MKNIVWLSLLASMTACASAVQFNKIPLTVADQTITVQVADTVEKRMRGLMEQSPVTHGMLLLNEQPRDMVLWMKNTPSDLDVAFFDSNWRIVLITQMQANTETLHPSGRAVLGALEMPLHWFSQHQVKIGDKIQNCQLYPTSCLVETTK